MLVPFEGFCGGSAPDVIKGVNSQQCINLYPASTTGGKASIILRKCPGQESFAASNGGNAEYYFASGSIYVSSLGDLYYLTYDSGVYIRRLYKNGGTVSTSFSYPTAKPFTVSDNGITLFMVAENIYITMLVSNNTLSNESSDPVLTGVSATHVAYLDGYFIINRVGTNRILVSPVDWDGSSAWDSLAVETDDQTPGAVEGLVVCGSDLWTFRKGGYSIYYNAGSTPFPFARNQSVSNSIGLQAPYSLVTVNNRVFWLGSGKDGNGKVFMSEGFNAVRISNPELETQISGYKNTYDTLGMGWQEYGHTFYSLTFKTENITWVYDATTGLWHQRSSKLSAAIIPNLVPNTVRGYFPPLANGTYGRWNVDGVVEFNGELYVKNAENGNVNKLKPTVYTDDSLPIIWRRTAPFLSAAGKRMFFNYLQVDMDTGTGLLPASAQGYDPIIFLRYSDDGGNTWCMPKQGNIGKIGTYNTRVKWNRLGSSKNRLFEISGADPVSTTIYQAFLDMEAENG